MWVVGQRLGKAGALVLVAAVYLPWAVLSGGTRISSAGVVLAAALVVTAGTLIPRTREFWKVHRTLLVLVLAAMMLATVQALRGSDVVSHNYFAALILGIALYFGGGLHSFRQAAVSVLYITLFLQFIELVVLDSYLFEVENAQALLSADLYRGNLGLLRAKGLFPGPLTAAGFAVVVAAMWRGRLVALIPAIASSLAAHGRLALYLLVVGAILQELLVRTPDRRTRIIRIVTGLAVLGVGAGVGAMYLGELVRENYVAALDITSSRNSARVSYWSQGLDLLSNRPVWSSLFGSPHLSYEVFGNSAESDVLQAALDAGLLGLVVLAAAAAWAVRKTRHRRTKVWSGIALVAAFPVAGNAVLAVGLATWATLLLGAEAGRRADSELLGDSFAWRRRRHESRPRAGRSRTVVGWWSLAQAAVSRSQPGHGPGGSG